MRSENTNSILQFADTYPAIPYALAIAASVYAVHLFITIAFPPRF